MCWEHRTQQTPSTAVTHLIPMYQGSLCRCFVGKSLPDGDYHVLPRRVSTGRHKASAALWELLTWEEATKRKREQHKDACHGHSEVLPGSAGGCRCSAPEMVPRGCLQIYTNTASELLDWNTEQPAESVSGTMRLVIFIEVLTSR